MVFPLAALGGGLSAFSGAASALGGFFGNSKNDAIHAENVRRVAEIDAANQQRQFENLSIGAKFRNQKARTQANLSNIDLAASEARATAQSQIDSQLDKFMMDRQGAYIKMMRNKRGPVSGRMNVSDRAMSAGFGRGQAAQAAQSRSMYNKLLSNEYVMGRQIQNAKGRELSKVASAPIMQAYQTDYKQRAYKSKGFGDFLQLAGGLAGAAASGMEFANSLKINNPGKTGGIFNLNNTSIFDQASIIPFRDAMNISLNK